MTTIARSSWAEARLGKRRREPARTITLRVPETLYIELHALCCDPRTGTMRYGVFTLACEEALRAWCNAQKVQHG